MDPNINYNTLHKVLQNVKNKHMLSKVVKYNKYKHKKSNWITHGIIKSIYYRDNLYKKMKMTDSNSIEYAIQKNNLNTYNYILMKSIRIVKNSYYETLFSKDDIKCTWKTINYILNTTKRKKNISQFFKDGNNVIRNKWVIADKFNSFFTNIGPTLSQKIKAPKNKTLQTYLTKTHNLNYIFHNVNEDEINQIIDKLAHKTSFGFDGL